MDMSCQGLTGSARDFGLPNPGSQDELQAVDLQQPHTSEKTVANLPF